MTTRGTQTRLLTPFLVSIFMLAGPVSGSVQLWAVQADSLPPGIKQEMVQLNLQIVKKIEGYDNPADLVVEGLIIAIKAIPKRPLLRAVFASEEGSRARRVVWSSDVIVSFGEELMDDVIRPATQAGILQDTVRSEILVEWVYRLLLSFLTLPSNWIKTDAQLRTTLHALLVPVLLK